MSSDDVAVNGVKHTPDDNDTPPASESDIDRFQSELQKTKDEKDALATQYNNLLTKLTDMRTRLGAKLKQDAVCLSPQLERQATDRSQ